MKNLLIVFSGFCLLAAVLMMISCEGLSGPRGPKGPVGPKGPDYQPPLPEDRMFTLAIANSSMTVHNGARKSLYLSFDSLRQTTGDTVVSVKLSESQVINIDGVDEGALEWSGQPTVVGIEKMSGHDNFIQSATVLSAYDDENIYFQIRWAEEADSEFGLTVTESLSPQRWIYPTPTSIPILLRRWARTSEGEDRAMLFFEISPVNGFADNGCALLCHAGEKETWFHKTNFAKERVDVWSWGSVSSNFTGYADDKYIDNSGVKGDVGTPPSRENLFTEEQTNDSITFRPLYQHINDPNSNSPDPMWDHQLAALNTTASSGWVPGNTIPSLFISIPSGSRADVMAKGKFENGTWTVEMKRKRVTGNGDDAEF